MKEITKMQVIGLMDSINREGIDNSHYDIRVDTDVKSSKDLWGGDWDIPLQRGSYCAIYAEEADLSDLTFVGRWIDENLAEDNFDIVFNGEGAILIVCLDLHD